MALVEGSCQPGAGQEARSPVILGVRRSETVSPIFTLMTLVESEPLPHLTQDGWKTPRAGTGPPRSMWLARCSCGARVYAWAVHPRHVEFLRF